MANVLVRELCLRPHKNILTVSVFQNDGVLGTFTLVEGTLAIGYQGGIFSLETLPYMTSNVGGY